jgi:excisionase family DNA binding protein
VNPDLLTVAEVADILRATPWFVTAECRAGTLRASKPGKSWLISRPDLQAYLDRHANVDGAA